MSGTGDWLRLAAAPTFAAMALLTAITQAPAAMVCAQVSGSPLAGMIPMYLLMSAFHAPPWLGLIARRRRLAERLKES